MNVGQDWVWSPKYDFRSLSTQISILKHEERFCGLLAQSSLIPWGGPRIWSGEATPWGSTGSTCTHNQILDQKMHDASRVTQVNGIEQNFENF